MDTELTLFLEEQKNPKTKRKTAYDVELFKCFIQTANPNLLGWTTSIHELSSTALNELVSKLFIASERRMDPREYEPEPASKVFFQVSSDISITNYGFITFKDVQFKATMATLKAKQKDLKAKSFENKTRVSDGLTDGEIIKHCMQQNV